MQNVGVFSRRLVVWHHIRRSAASRDRHRILGHHNGHSSWIFCGVCAGSNPAAHLHQRAARPPRRMRTTNSSPIPNPNPYLLAHNNTHIGRRDSADRPVCRAKHRYCFDASAVDRARAVCSNGFRTGRVHRYHIRTLFGQEIRV